MGRGKLPKGYSVRGADMGRKEDLPNDRNVFIKLALKNIMVEGGYDEGGAYWGTSEKEGPVWWAYGELFEEEERTSSSGYGSWKSDQVNLFIRAWDRDEAKKKILERLPNARFFK